MAQHLHARRVVAGGLEREIVQQTYGGLVGRRGFDFGDGQVARAIGLERLVRAAERCQLRLERGAQLGQLACVEGVHGNGRAAANWRAPGRNVNKPFIAYSHMNWCGTSVARCARDEHGRTHAPLKPAWRRAGRSCGGSRCP
jgi:hypothetical protein